MAGYPEFDPNLLVGEGGEINAETGQRRRWLICKGDYKYDPVTKEIIPELSPPPIVKVSDEEREAARSTFVPPPISFGTAGEPVEKPAPAKRGGRKKKKE